MAKVSVRYVPDQDAPVLIQRLQQHVASQFSALGSLNSVAVVVERVGQAWEGDPGSLPFKMAEVCVWGGGGGRGSACLGLVCWRACAVLTCRACEADRPCGVLVLDAYQSHVDLFNLYGM